jgi:hypothetical protein
MKNLITLILIIMFTSCSNNSDNTLEKQATNIYAHLDIFLKNSEGIDVLGSDKFPTNGIVANYLIDGKIVQDVSNAVISDYPNNIKNINERGIHCTRVFLNLAASEEYPITYIHWNATETDTIKAQYRRGNGNDGAFVVLEKAWLFENNSWKEISIEGIGERTPGVVTGGITLVK